MLLAARDTTANNDWSYSGRGVSILIVSIELMAQKWIFCAFGQISWSQPGNFTRLLHITILNRGYSELENLTPLPYQKRLKMHLKLSDFLLSIITKFAANHAEQPHAISTSEDKNHFQLWISLHKALVLGNVTNFLVFKCIEQILSSNFSSKLKLCSNCVASMSEYPC